MVSSSGCAMIKRTDLLLNILYGFMLVYAYFHKSMGITIQISMNNPSQLVVSAIFKEGKVS